MSDVNRSQFRHARDSDAHAIAALHADSWRRHYRGAYSEHSTTSGLYLWVLEQNVAAQDFYRRMGGRCVERALAAPPAGDTTRGHFVADTPTK